MRTHYLITYSVFKNCSVQTETEKISNEREARDKLAQKKKEFKAMVNSYPGTFIIKTENH